MNFESSYDIYGFLLCCIVLVVFILVFASMLTYIVRLSLIIIRGGLQDETLLKKYKKESTQKKKSNAGDKIFGVIFCLFAFCCLGFSLSVRFQQNGKVGNFPIFRVVYSNSMAQKNERNEYLFARELNDQFRKFDLILTRNLPTENDLQLYDIVVYELDGKAIVHRIVGIEEPNEHHPGHRVFFLQGDAVESRDKAPVWYDQMLGIYSGEKIPYVGSLVMFLQSMAGGVCVLALALSMFAVALLKRKVAKEERARLKILFQKKKKAYGVVQTEKPVGVPSAIVFYPIFYPAPCMQFFKNDGKRK